MLIAFQDFLVSGVRGQMTEVRGQKSEDRGQKSEDRRQKAGRTVTSYELKMKSRNVLNAKLETRNAQPATGI